MPSKVTFEMSSEDIIVRVYYYVTIRSVTRRRAFPFDNSDHFRVAIYIHFPMPECLYGEDRQATEKVCE